MKKSAVTARGWVSSAAALVLLCGCEASGASRIGQSENELRWHRGSGHGHAGSGGGSGSCTPVDSIDSMPDGVDEDCDGKVDEDVDHTKSECPKFSNIIQGTRGNDVLNGTSGRDCILGYGGDDIINGKGGDDVIFGGPGNDKISGGGGSDLVYAGAGDDEVDVASCTVSKVYGDAGHDKITGGKGTDMIFGGAGNDTIIGGGGVDLLSGEGCHDRIIGGARLDIAKGGAGVDSCFAEIALECERTGAKAKAECEDDGDCKASERCEPIVKFCVPSNAQVCVETSCTPVNSIDDTCDGIDDDCDGDIDDDFELEATTCGIGACAEMGEIACIDGEVVDTCEPGLPTGADNGCNGIDDDCNGLVDDAFLGTNTSCGAGVCRRDGNTFCSTGTLGDTCMPGAPSSALDTACNGLDDDCDGLVDDDFVAAVTTCGIGACAANGVLSCTAGGLSDSCVPGNPAASDATCNGIDDDCDGLTDEDFVGTATSCGVGACGATGSTSCVAGVVVDSCEPGAPASSDATCNNIDEDCNGLADEDFVGTATSCGTGACTAAGATSCQAGVIVDSCEVTCEGTCDDGNDDDGDGQLDCSDSDCSALPECQVTGIGSPCTTNSDCQAALGSSAICEIAIPGGYCTVPCDLGNPGNECPSGSVCWLGSACVLPCLEGDTCANPNHVCGDYSAAGLPPEELCRPTCAQSCPSGMACDPATELCF